MTRPNAQTDLQPSAQPSRGEWRRELRARRRALAPAVQRRAALALALRLLRQPEIRRARTVALYMAQDGEIDPSVFAALAGRRHQRLLVPVLRQFPAEHVRFAAWARPRRQRRNRFGIPEPVGGRAWAATEVDVILLPLVGFDESGARLGMGGGFYDRTLAFKQRQAARKPVLIGLAHECQKVERLPVAGWDVSLRAVITDRRRYNA